MSSISSTSSITSNILGSFENIGIRIAMIIIGIVLAYFLYIKIIKNKFLYPLCFIDTNDCLQIKYWKIDNSLLANVLPSNYWFWYNGRMVYVYRQPTGMTCVDSTNYESVFTVDISQGVGKVVGYECIRMLEEIQKYYIYHQSTSGDFSPNEGIQEPNILYVRPDKDPGAYSIIDIINEFLKKEIMVRT